MINDEKPVQKGIVQAMTALQSAASVAPNQLYADQMMKSIDALSLSMAGVSDLRSRVAELEKVIQECLEEGFRDV